jgi:serine protease AprX
MLRAVPGVVVVACLMSLSTSSRPIADRADDGPAARVIVQGVGAADAVRGVGGILTHDLSVIDAVAAPLTRRQRAQLAERGFRLYDDHEVRSTGTATSASRTVKDQFTQVSYSNNHGTQRWANNWVEIGDDGEPWQSDHISIVDDLLGKRLRIASGGKSIWRKATLPSTATKATLTFKYRRANLESGDCVSVQASSNGGTSWTTVGRLCGAANDLLYRSATYDLTAYRSAQTAVRFSSELASNGGLWTWPNDAVFIDDVQLEYDGFVPGNSYPVLSGVSTLHGQGIRGTGVAVAVIDSGHWSHPNLDNGSAGWMRVMAQYDAIRNVLDAYNGAPPVSNDGSGHGSHVASLIAGSGRASDGKFFGVAPNAQLISIKAFDTNGAGRYADVIRAIGWVVTNRNKYDIRVLNCSFSAGARSHYWDDPINQAVMRAWHSGVAVVASAGNRGPSPMTIGVPGNVPYVITVGAVSDNVTPTSGSDDFLTSFSSTGPTIEGFVKPEILAPGGHAWGLMATGARIAQQYPQFRNDGDYFTMSGTSQSTAVVSGVLALMFQRQWVTPDDAKCLLMSSARAALNSSQQPAYSVFQQGAGLIDAVAAVNGTARGCANQGMDLAGDIAGTRHYGGPARRDTYGRYYLEHVSGPGYTWSGGYTKGSGLYWSSSYAWSDELIWNDELVWVDELLWIDELTWLDELPWIDSGPSWTGELTEAVAINIWAPQE